MRVPPKDESKPAPKRRTTTPKPATNRNRRLVHLVVLFVASVIVVDSLVGERGLLAILRARHEGEQLSAIIARQRDENARLREQANRLRDDPTAIEEIARRELGLIKPGERVFILKDIPAVKR